LCVLGPAGDDTILADRGRGIVFADRRARVGHDPVQAAPKGIGEAGDGVEKTVRSLSEAGDHDVAATRAKENLFISYPTRVFDRSSRMILSRPSQFIEGMAEDLLEPASLVDEQSNWSWES